MSDAKFSFSFGAKASGSKPAAAPMSNMERLLAQAKAKPAAKAKPIGNLFDDEDDGPAPPVSSQKAPVLLSRSERRAQEEALKIDQSVFNYDEVYDGMKAAERAMEDARKEANAEKKPKYIDNFLAAAQTRRLDRLRAEEKMLQHEREKEGDEFEDKEKFVTEAYKKQMEEVRLAEEEERKREGMSVKMSVKELCLTLDEMRKSNKGPGLSGMYRSMLDDQEAKHAAAVASTSKPVPGPSLTIRPPAFDDEEEYDPMLAREAKADKLAAGSRSVNTDTGKEIEINDEGEIVDKRSLLKAGLNITKMPAAVPNSLLTGQRSRPEDNKPYVSRAVGTAASYQERMARERKRLADQVREQEEKKRAEAERRAREEEEEARKRREGDNGEAERKRNEAKERFLARKRQREEEARESKKKHKE